MPFKILNFIVPIALCYMSLVATVACRKNPVKEPAPPAADTSQKIYIAGYIISQIGDYTATYWKNDSAISLPNNISISAGYPQANAIFVNGSDIYVAGFNRFVGLYWKNQVLQPILNAVDLVPKSIFISGKDIYVAGDSVHDYPSNTNSYGTYWKNNAAMYLPTCNIATSIIVSGNDVYVTGSGTGKAAYWKNGVPVYLPDLNGNSSYAFGITISGNNVYVAGDASTSSGYPAVYWENGVATNLENGIHASGIAVSNSGDVYVCGQSAVNFNSRATYWKNGKAIVLSNSISNANSIAISGQDVYVVGDTSRQTSTAVYWKNGVLTPLTKGIVGSSATSIFISK